MSSAMRSRWRWAHAGRCMKFMITCTALHWELLTSPPFMRRCQHSSITSSGTLALYLQHIHIILFFAKHPLPTSVKSAPCRLRLFTACERDWCCSAVACPPVKKAQIPVCCLHSHVMLLLLLSLQLMLPASPGDVVAEQLQPARLVRGLQGISQQI